MFLPVVHFFFAVVVVRTYVRMYAFCLAWVGQLRVQPDWSMPASIGCVRKLSQHIRRSQLFIILLYRTSTVAAVAREGCLFAVAWFCSWRIFCFAGYSVGSALCHTRGTRYHVCHISIYAFGGGHLRLCCNVARCRRTAAGAVVTDKLARGVKSKKTASSILSLCHR